MGDRGAVMNTTGRRRREPKTDALPEFQVYRDDGCEVSPSCLRCPLPVCKYDDPGMLSRARRRQRDTQVKELLARDIPVAEVAQRSGVGLRTIARIKAGAR